jgi:hypothetical protein
MMAHIRPFKNSAAHIDPRRDRDNYTQILALFHLYFGSSPDLRQAIVEEILQLLALHRELQEPLFQEILRFGPQGRMLVKKINVMIPRLQQSSVDDWASDEFPEVSARGS